MNLDAEFSAARQRIYEAIDVAAEKQRKWLRNMVITINRSIGQRARWAKHRSKT